MKNLIMDDKKIQQGPSLAYTSSPDYKKPAKTQNPYLQSLGAPHVESFNYMLDEGLAAAIEDLIPAEFEFPNGERCKVTIDEAVFCKPTIPMDIIGVRNNKIMPTECRQRAATYKGEFKVRISYTVNNHTIKVDRSLGAIPVMIRSKLCHLADMSPKELVESNEHGDEWGGYFIAKGHDRLARMLLVTRRNFPVAIRRSGWRTRGNLFSDSGILVRCVRPDHTATNNVLHFLTNGTCKLMFSHRRVLYYAPLLLLVKCVSRHADHQLYKLLLAGRADDLYFVSCIQNMVRELHEEGLHSRAQSRQYLGRMFRGKLADLPPWTTNEEVAEFLLSRSVLTHLTRDEDKLHALVYMAQKLFSLVQDKCKPEGADAVMVQEVLVGGHLYLQVLKERLQMLLYSIKSNLLKTARMGRKIIDSEKDFILLLKKCGTLEQKMETFISTGNAPSANINLPQHKGLTIVAENINRMRYMSHFKAIHRGAFFMEMRTTDARQLLPDAWGFVCPVHTPDGAPCGLLNHLTQAAQITGPPPPELVENLPRVLERCGMEPISTLTNSPLPVEAFYYPVFVDGRLVGVLAEQAAPRAAAALRALKGCDVPVDTEVVLIPRKQVAGQYPGFFLCTSPGRLARPVLGLAAGRLELIGTLEQLYMDIAVAPSEIIKGVTTHLELSKSAFMSNLAQLVPMPDCNQSPRNMYQCQMGKQTMGTPIHTWRTNAETKLYRLQTPATPLFRPAHYDNIGLDDYPMGTNAIVAVISYTGYDMEDAMIINRSSHQRGFAAGCIYKTEIAELEPDSYFARDPNSDQPGLDEDGLPAVGAVINTGDPLYSYFAAEKNDYVLSKYKGKESTVVDSVRQCGAFSGRRARAAIVLRVQRNPSVGDKFASRAGQKGICSQLWPAEDLPFSEAGLVPDVLFNPHGFPSRMTIAMMVECMAGKSAAAHGLVHDATPFRFTEKDTAIDYFGRLLEQAGYNYYGTERLYSGADGRELTADIFTGVIHYQRLRHMVSDKWQVRTTGAMDALTRQPVKGRRRGGGVRLGEMERDALLAHGASFLLHDRLFHCSDKTQAVICTSCGTLLGGTGSDQCRLCPDGKGTLASVSVPYIFKFFVTQLAAVNINVKINVSDASKFAIEAS